MNIYVWSIQGIASINMISCLEFAFLLENVSNGVRWACQWANFILRNQKIEKFATPFPTLSFRFLIELDTPAARAQAVPNTPNILVIPNYGSH